MENQITIFPYFLRFSNKDGYKEITGFVYPATK